MVIENRSRAPLIRLDIFLIRSLTASNGAMLFVVSGLFAMFYFTARPRAPTLATSRTDHVVNGFGHPASIVEQTSAQVDGYQFAFTAGAFPMLAAGVVALGFLRRADVATIDAGDAVTVPV